MKLSGKEWLLKIATEVEQDPSRWTQGANALDANGEQNFKRAVCWCANGFSVRDFDMPIHYAFRAKVGEALRLAAGTGIFADEIPFHNDSLATATEFVAWFRRAAELCE